MERVERVLEQLERSMGANDGTLPQLLTVQDLANLLRTSPKGVRVMRERGQLPDPIDIGSKRLLWRASDVSQWLNRKQSRAAGSTPR
jgi:predicted DNA-binding transcriptional regulator AlpA